MLCFGGSNYSNMTRHNGMEFRVKSPGYFCPGKRQENETKPLTL
jgi:hypothetical protein